MSNQSNSAADAHDIGFIMGALSAFNVQFNRHIAAMKRAQTDSATATLWLTEVQATMALAATWLESKSPFIQSGATLQGQSEAARILATGDLLSTFRDQREFAVLMEEDLPSSQGARLLVILDKLIASVQEQRKKQSGMVIMREGDLRRLIKNGPYKKAQGPDNWPRDSRRTVAKSSQKMFGVER